MHYKYTRIRKTTNITRNVCGLGALFIIYVFTFNALAVDRVKLNHGHSDKDKRHLYNWAVITRALDVTKDEFGNYEIIDKGPAIPNHQQLKELMLGNYLNVAVVLTNEAWESKIEPIRIPVKPEASNYRVLLIHKKNAAKFAEISTFGQLSKFTAGIRKSWALKDELLKRDIPVVYAYSYEALFAMLNKDRFDYIPRGIHEAYNEFDIRSQELTNLYIESTLLVEYPTLHSYIFVSPTEPRLRLRLQQGLSEMQDSGELDSLFENHYSEQISRLEVETRAKIKVE